MIEQHEPWEMAHYKRHIEYLEDSLKVPADYYIQRAAFGLQLPHCLSPQDVADLADMVRTECRTRIAKQLVTARNELERMEKECK